jgi:hypothetical protein
MRGLFAFPQWLDEQFFMHPAASRLIVAVLVALLAGGIWWTLGLRRQNQVQAEPPEVAAEAEAIAAARADGRYDQALTLLKEAMRRHGRFPEVVRLKEELLEPLEVDFRLRYIPGQRLPVTEGKNKETLSITAQDPYYFFIRPSAECYLYVMQTSASDGFLVLYPNSQYSQMQNPVPPTEIRLPEMPGWLRARPSQRMVHVYLIASRWRMDQMERSLMTISGQAEGPDRSESIRNLLERVVAEEAATDKLPGLVYGHYQFNAAGYDTGS